jgi:hypothetical protein
MDRGERRRRDENYVKWISRRYFNVTREGFEELRADHPLRARRLGLRKYGPWRCHHCSKKRPGKPKLARGACGLGMDRSPKKGRSRWKLDIGSFD